ncbi:MAG: hypothetical protein WBG40_03130, partial [Candidatus Sulfotelmatobacter sp.]
VSADRSFLASERCARIYVSPTDFAEPRFWTARRALKHRPETIYLAGSGLGDYFRIADNTGAVSGLRRLLL